MMHIIGAIVHMLHTQMPIHVPILRFTHGRHCVKQCLLCYSGHSVCTNTVQPAEKISREPGVPAQVLLDVKHFMKDYGGHMLPAVTALGHGARPPLQVGRVPYPTRGIMPNLPAPVKLVKSFVSSRALVIMHQTHGRPLFVVVSMLQHGVATSRRVCECVCLCRF